MQTADEKQPWTHSALAAVPGSASAICGGNDHSRTHLHAISSHEGLHERLSAMGHNQWWTWHPEVITLFRDLDPVRWRQLDHNPITLLNELSGDQLLQRANELVLSSKIDQAYRRFQEYLHSEISWGTTQAGVLRVRPVAYFSAEFGLHESLPIYSGGLGLLAGDHLKSASDLGVPLVGVGLFYSQGYFLQRMNGGDWQQEESMRVDVKQLPLEPAVGPNGSPLSVKIETRRGDISARVWLLRVGRVTLLLLDSAVEDSRPEDRELTAHLYGGDLRTRIRQELLLGVGGVRVLRALGIRPGVLHLNEGHSAFATLELIRERMLDEGIEFSAARKRVASQTVFTTHTPVAAGHDSFFADLIEEHLGPLREDLRLSQEQLMELGRVDRGNRSESFCMTVLALRMSRKANAVSALHGHISRTMWTGLWPGRTEREVPIGHITNGVHIHSWLAPPMHELYDSHLGPDWERRSSDPQAWLAIEQVNHGELWATHQFLKSRLLDFVHRRVAFHRSHGNNPAPAIVDAERDLKLDTLTIGFARRFATYKRSTLILKDIERLAAMVNCARTPIQFVFAGKGHPHDEAGKKHLQEIVRLTRDPRFAGRFVFVEDYDINVSRHLIQGVDVWLNTPRRPLEASGTSGQKVVLNGGLNLSILDGWWAEAFDGSNGFAIGMGETHSSAEVQDQRDADALYETLEREVIPLYYDRDEEGLPRGWIARMKRAIRTLGWRFNADRMVMDYVRQCYLPAAGGLSCDMSVPAIA